MSLHYTLRRPHSNPSYPQPMSSFADHHGSTPSPLVAPLPLFKPMLPMGTIHRHLKRKSSSISSEAGQKEEPCLRPMRHLKKPRLRGPDGQAVQAHSAQPVAVPLPPEPDPVHIGGTRITAVTSAWTVRPASKDDGSSESDTSDDEDETMATHTTRYLATHYRSQPC